MIWFIAALVTPGFGETTTNNKAPTTEVPTTTIPVTIIPATTTTVTITVTVTPTKVGDTSTTTSAKSTVGFCTMLLLLTSVALI